MSKNKPNTFFQFFGLFRDKSTLKMLAHGKWPGLATQIQNGWNQINQPSLQAVCWQINVRKRRAVLKFLAILKGSHRSTVKCITLWSIKRSDRHYFADIRNVFISADQCSCKRANARRNSTAFEKMLPSRIRITTFMKVSISVVDIVPMNNTKCQERTPYQAVIVNH